MKIKNFWLSSDEKASHILVENICKTYLTKTCIKKIYGNIFN